MRKGPREHTGYQGVGKLRKERRSRGARHKMEGYGQGTLRGGVSASRTIPHHRSTTEASSEGGEKGAAEEGHRKVMATASECSQVPSYPSGDPRL